MSLAYILGQKIGPNPFYLYELSRFYGNSSIDIYYVERIIAYEKLLIIAMGGPSSLKPVEANPKRPADSMPSRAPYSIPLNATKANKTETTESKEETTITKIIAANFDLMMSLTVLGIALALAIVSSMGRQFKEM